MSWGDNTAIPFGTSIGNTDTNTMNTPTNTATTSGKHGFGKRRKSRIRHETYNIYIYKVIKQVHPEMGVSKKAMQCLNSFVIDMFTRIANEASNLVCINNKNTLDSRCIQSATQLCVPGELAKHGTSEGTKAVCKFHASIEGKSVGEKRVRKSQSQRAGLQFPVGRMARHLKEGKYAQRIGGGAPVYLAAVLEYFTAELVELAGNAAKDNKRQRIIPRHIMLAVKNDEELSKLFKFIVLPQAGVMPNIYSFLLPSLKKRYMDQNKTFQSQQY
eukprot:440695_1